MKKLFIITLGLGSIFLLGCQSKTSTIVPIASTGEIIEEPIGEIKSFEDCVNAGLPVMESYPRQCNDGITTYTEILSGNILSGDNLDLSGNNSELSGDIVESSSGLQNIETTNTGKATNTETSELEKKLKAMVERRNQEVTNTGSTKTTSATTNEGVTEDDIENLEKILDEIIKK